jgi:hypothetical protein
LLFLPINLIYQKALEVLKMIPVVAPTTPNLTSPPLTKKSSLKEYEETKNCSNGECSVELGNPAPKNTTYSKPEISTRSDYEEINQLKKAAEDALMPLRRLVEQLLVNQGLTFLDSTSKLFEGPMVPIDEEIRLEAQRSISEGGEYSIENTSQRLFDFAVALSGGDKSKIEMLKEFVTAGFKEAEKIFGGNLPQISYDTYERTLEKLDAWRGEK